jgi:signal transduction histidine kinase/CheY-like chemotaxis protein
MTLRRLADQVSALAAAARSVRLGHAVILFLILALSYLVALSFNVFELIHAFSLNHEAWQADEIFGGLMLSAFGLAIYSWCRTRELKRELGRRIETEQKLAMAKDHAEAANAAKGAFLANMSHEVRTPLNGILGMAEALAQDGLSPDQEEKLGILRESCRTLMTVVNDVLDHSKIDAGKLAIVPTAVDIIDSIRHAVDLFVPQAADKGLELVLSIDAGMPPKLKVDPVRTRQCIINLLSNAIKFTADGRIDVSARYRETETKTLLEISVADTGIGMTEEQVARLFSEFMQADDSTSRRFGGTGLGLSISRRLARLMGGDLVVKSELNRGSIFTLTVQAEPVAAAEITQTTASQPARESLRGRRVLLADDNAINRKVVMMFLKPLGVVVTEAEDGTVALDKLASEPFDAVLMDIHMPAMDGAEAVRRIRASGAPWAGIPVVALTANAMQGDRERYLGLGMDGYVSKPIEQHELAAALTDVLQIPSRRSAA